MVDEDNNRSARGQEHCICSYLSRPEKHNDPSQFPNHVYIIMIDLARFSNISGLPTFNSATLSTGTDI